MSKYAVWLSGLIVATFASSAMADAIVGGVPSFIATRAQIEMVETGGPLCGDPGDPYHVCVTSLGTAFSEAGSLLGAYGKAGSDFGVNRAYASVSALQINHEAYAESIWSDAFVVHGGSGASTLQISVRVDGALDGRGRPGGPGSNAFYTLFVSDAPITCDFDALTCSGAVAIPLSEALSGTRFFQADIAFTYDKPFYIASYLGAEVVGGSTGVADFFHSAHLGISAPEGASLMAASGANYPTVSAVPEPGAITMALTGALLLGAVRRRR